MKGLMVIPTVTDLQGAYIRLNKLTQIDEEKLSLWSQWTRFDPRLGEIFVTYIARCWQEINPIRLNIEIKKQPWPAALGVLLEQAWLFSKLKFNDVEQQPELFNNWSQCVMTDINKAKNEQFFIGINAFAGKQMKKVAIKPIKLYKKWGYLANAILINKYQGQNRFTLSTKAARQTILEELIAKQDIVTVEDYMQALDHCISRRQAQRDLAANKRLKAKSFTRGRYYQT